MAATQAQLDAIDLAIASNALSVKYQDREIRYRSMEELLLARQLIYNQLFPPGSTNGVKRRTLVMSDKGY